MNEEDLLFKFKNWIKANQAKLEVVLQKYMTLDEEIEEEVRKRLKNLEEGSSAWDIEYKKMLLKMKSKYQLE